MVTEICGRFVHDFHVILWIARPPPLKQSRKKKNSKVRIVFFFLFFIVVVVSKSKWVFLLNEDLGKNMETEQKEIEKEGMEKQWEKAEEVKRLPPWTKQITVRGVIASIVIGSMYSVIAMKLNLTAGLTPHLNISAALLGFVFIRTWTKLLQRTGFATTPFTCQENTMIQTCSVACYSIAVGGLHELYTFNRIQLVCLRLNVLGLQDFLKEILGL